MSNGGPECLYSLAGEQSTTGVVEAGDRVVVPWIIKAERDEVEGLFSDALGARQLTLVEADIVTPAGAENVAGELERVDVLVNGAGGFAGGAPVHETALEVWESMYRINVLTAVAMCRAVLPRMLERGQGHIVNVASRAATDRPAGLAAYSAAKAAIGVLTETLQKEVSDSGLRVNAVVPTTIDTPANREAMPDADFSSWTAPDRIATVIHWLVSDAASAVRAALIPV